MNTRLPASVASTPTPLPSLLAGGPAPWLRRRLGGVALAAALATALATPWAHAEQQLLPAQSSVHFTIKQMGVAVQGQFKRFDAQVAFDPAKLATSRIAFNVDVGSATMGSPEVDFELPKPAWLGAAQHPQARFQSSAIKALGGGRFEVSGQLTLKGTARPVVVPVTLTQSGAGASLLTTASGVLPIKRLAFKVGEGEWTDTSLVADEVQVGFKLALQGVPKL